MARRATTRTTASKAAIENTTVFPAVEITNDTMVECRNGTAGTLDRKSVV